ncbi:uncharacterized protein LOC143280960 [Babylonia areolata]|uniref:uncharacterized protein LOC143280960 n=1 Tax=Babylonia areolata TaxID=304850 RepID=UPI003FD53C73
MDLKFVLLAVVFVTWSGVETAEYTCEQLDSNTNIIPFNNGKKAMFAVPCKYNAVRQKCGDHIINVSPGFISIGKHYRLDTVWLGVKTGDAEWEGRTTNKKAVKFLNGNSTELYAKMTDTGPETSDVVNFTVEKKATVATALDGSFKVVFGPWDPDRKDFKKSFWSFSCLTNEPFVMSPYPQQVCGDNARDVYSGSDFASQSDMFLFHVFNETDAKIKQMDGLCLQAETTFQTTCQNDDRRKDAILTCGQILAEKLCRNCVTKYACSPMQVFVACLDWACSGYTNQTACAIVGASIDLCRTFTTGNLTQKMEDAKCYKEFIPITVKKRDAGSSAKDE